MFRPQARVGPIQRVRVNDQELHPNMYRHQTRMVSVKLWYAPFSQCWLSILSYLWREQSIFVSSDVLPIIRLVKNDTCTLHIYMLALFSHWTSYVVCLQVATLYIILLDAASYLLPEWRNPQQLIAEVMGPHHLKPKPPSTLQGEREVWWIC